MRNSDSGKRRISYQPLAGATIVALCTLLAVTPAKGQQLVGHNIQAIDAAPLGSLDTEVWGLNDAGDIVGAFAWAHIPVLFGFQLSHDRTGVFTMGYSPVIPPRAQDSRARGMDADGDITGFYTGFDNVEHAFLLRNNCFYDVDCFTTLDFPKATSTSALGINSTGQDIVGTFDDIATNSHGFHRSAGGTWTRLSYGDKTWTTAKGINRHGAIVGFFQVGMVRHGFLLPAGAITPIAIDYPHAINTQLGAINDYGDMIGRYEVDLTGTSHVFFKKRHTSPTTGFSRIADPVVGTSVREGGINNFGRICGTYDDPVASHGFCEDAP